MKRYALLIISFCAIGPFVHAQVPADTLQDVRPFGTHALDRLVGREAGVEVISSPGAPGMTPTVHIRGFGVIPGIEPVYIVDGMRRRNLDDLAPESIEKIEVLKDASSMGLYGPDAAAGVVVVTTKRATEKGFHAGYVFTGGFQSLAHEPAPLPLAEWAAFWGVAFHIFNPDVSETRKIYGHAGNTPKDSAGCILFGMGIGLQNASITYSRKAMSLFRSYYNDKNNVKMIIR